MKRIKIMLISLLVLGAIGGALAFMAKEFENDYCTTTPRMEGNAIYCSDANGRRLTCPIKAYNRKTTVGGRAVCTAKMPWDGNCDVKCSMLTFTTSDE